MTRRAVRLKARLVHERNRRLTCESCGVRAKWRLADRSTWCTGCHLGSVRAGYDTDGGTFIGGRG